MRCCVACGGSEHPALQPILAGCSQMPQAPLLQGPRHSSVRLDASKRTAARIICCLAYLLGGVGALAALARWHVQLRGFASIRERTARATRQLLDAL